MPNRNLFDLMQIFETIRQELNVLSLDHSLSSLLMIEKSQELDDVHNELILAMKKADCANNRLPRREN